MRSVAKSATSEVRYVRTLVRALQIAGGEEQLAALLQTPPHLLRKWLTGDLQPPINKYITALQLVSARGVRDSGG